MIDSHVNFKAAPPPSCDQIQHSCRPVRSPPACASFIFACHNLCARLCASNILCLHEPVQDRALLMPAEVRSGHRGVLLWAERQGEAFGASGKQSGLNWSLTGLTCLHLHTGGDGGSRCLGLFSLYQHNHR